MNQEIDDPTLAAYCHFKGLKVTPFKKSDNRIAFHIEGDVEVILNEILENKKVPINDFLKALKSVRSAMFTLRNLGRR